MANELSGLTGWKLLKAIRGRKEAPRQNEGVATVTRKNADGTTYVRLPGSTIDTPVNGTMTASVEMGQTVGYRIDSGRLSVIGNVSSPAVGQNVVKATVAPVELKADRALQEAERAHQAADAAENDAARARTAAESAETDAARAAGSADIAEQSAGEAQESASQAATAATNAQKSAGQAATAAQEAQGSAASAAGSAESAAEDATSAARDAAQANKHANDALTQLSFVEDVAGTLQWIQEHGTFVATSDTSVQEGTVYFEYDSTTHDYVPIVSPPSDANPQQRGWYVLDVTDSQTDFIMAHIAVTTRGLWVLPSGVASTDQTVDPDIDSASSSDTAAQRQANANARKGTDYKVLLSSDGMYVYDGSGRLVATYGESVRFSADRPQYIGNDDAYIVFTPEHVESGETVPATVTIGGRVVMGGTQTLAELLDSALMYDHTFSKTNGIYTFIAHLYYGNTDVTTQVDPDCFSWTLRSESGDTFLGTGLSMTVAETLAGYRASVRGEYHSVVDGDLVDANENKIIDASGDVVAVHSIWEVTATA